MIRNAPTVSVVIPCHNLGAYVDEAVQSVLNQTFPDFEILLIDDGSTDPITQALFTSYQRPRTRLFRTKNQGLAQTRNFGIAESTGRFVTFLNADHLLEPAFLERTVALLEREPDLAFASCWVKVFGESSFLWNPTTCDFPHLLAENTVCSAALRRKDALLALGGFDPNMPVPGYEGWDLAIGMVERDYRGRIVPEYLFRYRISGDSTSESSTSPQNHALLMKYILEKHPASYQTHLAEVLETIERRTDEMEVRPTDPAAAENAESRNRRGLLEDTLRRVLESRNWKASRPLRRMLSRLKSKGARPSGRANAPRVSAVITCLDDGVDLVGAFESMSLQVAPSDEIVIVDAGSKDAVTLQFLDDYRGAGIRVLRAPFRSRVRAREAGLALARAPYLVALDARQRLESGTLPRALEILEADSSIEFVSGGVRDASGFSWATPAADLPALLSCPRHAFPVMRKDRLAEVGGYDGALPELEPADWDLALRLAASNLRGEVIAKPLIRYPQASGEAPADWRSSGSRIRPVFDKHRQLFERHWEEVVLGHENWRRCLQAFACDPPEAARTEGSVTVDWGGLRRLEPVSRVWGVDRGQPIDRYYIERFLSIWRADIRGRVLEVKEPTYANAFGAGVERVDIVDIAPDNPAATIVADLSSERSLPAEAFDCFVLIQTIHIIYRMREVLQNAARSLKAGGTLLATLPCVSRLDYESGVEGDFWRFTPASARRLVEEAFPGGDVEVRTYGNVLACCGFLHGIAAGELTASELDAHDVYFPLLVCVRAVKAPATGNRIGTSSDTENESRRSSNAAVLLYHRVDRPARDRWGLCVSPGRFAAHMELLAKRFDPQPLSRLAKFMETGRIPPRSVAVTFDDGYRDNLDVALPILKGLGIPATFFVSGDGAAEDGSFWWEVLDGSMEQGGLNEDAARELHWRLMHSSLEDRRRILEDFPAPLGALPPRLTRADLVRLSREPLAEIGAHGWSHRALAGLPEEAIRLEVAANVEALVDTTGLPIVSFAYPFGGPESPETQSELRRAGMRVGCVIGEKPVTARTPPLSIPRLEIRDCSAEEVMERIERVLISERDSAALP